MSPRPLVVAVALSVLVAACGGDDADTTSGADAAITSSASTPDPGDGPAPSGDPPQDDPQEETTTSDRPGTLASQSPDGADDDPSVTSVPDEVVYPLEVDHVFGTTTITERPARVVTLGVGEHDYALSLGVTPIGLRLYSPTQSFPVWPWAQDELGAADPVQIAPGELNLEQIATLEPDVIMAMTSAIDDQEYELLAQIAPTVARPPGTRYQGVLWRDVLATHGQVLGRPVEAASVEADLDDLFAASRAAHPEFADATVSVVFYNSVSDVGTYTPQDVLYQFMGEFGIRPADTIDELTSDAVRAFPISPERLDVLDADVILWLPAPGVPATALAAIATRELLLSAVDRRSEIAADGILFTALFNTSPLSAEYLVERLVPELAAALDGDPETVPASTATRYGVAERTPTPDERAAMDAWEIALGSDATLEEKRPHIEGFDELEPTVVASIAAGRELGGVTISTVRASIIGDTAFVTFDADIGGGSTPGLQGELRLVDGTWVATREQVCTYVAFIGVTCPAGES